MKKKKEKRTIEFVKKDGEVDRAIELGMAVSVKLGSEKEFIYFEKMKDGKWRLTWTPETIEDFKDIDCLRIVREE